MELWIKSQDKECLMKIDRVDYDLSNSEHRIMVNGYKTLVGHYATKERALEVLDEIQEILEQVNDPNLTILPILVYEMPKE